MREKCLNCNFFSKKKIISGPKFYSNFKERNEEYISIESDENSYSFVSFLEVDWCRKMKCILTIKKMKNCILEKRYYRISHEE